MSDPTNSAVKDAITQLLKALNESEGLTRQILCDPKDSLGSPDLSFDLVDGGKAALQRAEELLRQEVASRSVEFDRLRNTLPYIHRLPNELFLDIISTSLEDELHSWTVNRLYELSRVSTTWRDVVRNSPQLWAILNFSENWGMALRLSKEAPLTIYYPVDFFPSTGTVKRLCKRLRPHMHRVKTLWIESSGSIHPMFLDILRCSMPLLRLLRFNDRHVWGEQTFIPISLKGSPALSSIYLRGGYLVWEDLHPAFLTSFTLEEVSESRSPNSAQIIDVLINSPGLKELSICDIPRISGPYDGSQMEGCLQSVPTLSLSSLRVEWADELFVARLIQMVEAKHLRQLFLSINCQETLPENDTVQDLLTKAYGLKPSFLSLAIASILPTGLDIELRRRYIGISDSYGLHRREDQASKLGIAFYQPRGLHEDPGPSFALGSFIAYDIPTRLDMQYEPPYDMAGIRQMSHLVDVSCSEGCAEKLLDILSDPLNAFGMWPCPRLVRVQLRVNHALPSTTTKIANMLQARPPPIASAVVCVAYGLSPSDPQLLILDGDNHRFNKEKGEFTHIWH